LKLPETLTYGLPPAGGKCGWQGLSAAPPFVRADSLSPAQMPVISRSWLPCLLRGGSPRELKNQKGIFAKMVDRQIASS